MKIENLDHMVLTVANMEQSIYFYTEILGMELVTFGHNRKAVSFGNQKINLHEYGNGPDLVAKTPCPGSGDLCFITKTPIKEVQSHLISKGVRIEVGPVERDGALGKMVSIYTRDPDENLIEIANY